MVFCKEDNREFLQSLKTLVQRDREAGEYVPPNFDSILQSLDEMSAKNDGVFLKTLEADVSTTYSPGRKEYEILQAYNSLVEAGGRPVCRLGDTNHVSKDPGRYSEILVPWTGGTTSASDDGLDWKGIYQQQLSNWQQFRAWQRAHRDAPAYSEQVSAGASSRFEVHVESTRERLTHCGFTKSFCFNNDTDRQDDWTTWIEYLSFECYCLDDCSRHLRAEGLGNLRIAMRFDYPASAAQGNDHSSRASSSSGLEEKSTSSPFSSNQSGDGASRAPSATTTVDAQKSPHPAVTRMDDSPASGNASQARSELDDTVAGKSTKLNDAHHHNLILRWAFLQEPEIAAMCAQQPGIGSVHETAALKSGLGRRKRHRDGSRRGSAASFSQVSRESVPNDEFNELEPKRCRSSG
ncbi:hypothetical protein E4U41_001184 [Claviceps citrina]|nr:hypothetical protein E4U41_001184 [Claviceps citrina]